MPATTRPAGPSLLALALGAALEAAAGGLQARPSALPGAAPFSLPAAFGAAWKPISVADFGATGDGATNDGPAIQAAIDAALAGGSLCVWFPPGDYVTNRTLLASGSADRPTKSPVSLRGYTTAANTRILLRLDKPAPPRPALPTSVVKFQGASMGTGAAICDKVSGGFCAGAGVFSHTVIANLAIDANVTGDPLSNNTAGIEWAAVIGGTVRDCVVGLTGLEVGMLLHNNANGSYTEFCQAHDTVFGGITAVQYLISDVASHVSFHGSGLIRAAIQGSRNSENPVIRVGPYPRWLAVYNAPLDFQFWQEPAVPVILVEPPTLGGGGGASGATAQQTAQGVRGAIVQTHGTVTLEGNPAVVAAGAPVYHAGDCEYRLPPCSTHLPSCWWCTGRCSLHLVCRGVQLKYCANFAADMCWGDADAVSLGSFYLVQSVGWGGGGGEGLGALGINAVLAPIQSKQTIRPGNTTLNNPFSALGRDCFAQVPTYLLAIEIGEPTTPSSPAPSGDGGIDATAQGARGGALVRTLLVECGSTAMPGCVLSTVGRGRSSFPGAGGQQEPKFTVVDDGSIMIETSKDWPTAGVPMAATMTQLAQGAGAHDTHALPTPPPPSHFA
eukprot:SAG22_NODE_2389_length_2624_cov_2.359857_1_plen_613_part_00